MSVTDSEDMQRVYALIDKEFNVIKLETHENST